MPAVWELQCPKRVRSRRSLFREGVEALRRDEGVRRVSCSKTPILLCAKITFWNDGPVDEGLAHLREEFGLANVDRPMPVPFGATPRLPRVALDLETSMGAMVSAGRRSMGRINFPVHEITAIMNHALASGVGRSQLAEIMIRPIRMPRDYASLARLGEADRLASHGAVTVYDQDTTPALAPGAVYVAGEPGFVGPIPARTELTVLSADEVPQFRFYRSGSGIAIPTQAPVAVPSWCVPGVWLYDRSTGRFAIVRVVHEGNRAGVSYWYRGHASRRNKIILGVELHLHWNPCDGPKMPRESWWEDLLRDDFAGL